MTTENKETCYLGYFPASLGFNEDNGLGFGQGSTAGVYNQYYRGGFHRPKVEEVDEGIRRRFNLKDRCDPYRCHYDPEPYYENKQVQIRWSDESELNKISSLFPDQMTTLMNLIIIIIVLFILFGKYSF